MKLMLLISTLALASCGKITLPQDAQLDTLKSTKPQPILAGSTQYLKIKRICDALEAKANYVSNLVGSQYTFAGTNKACEAAEFTNLGDSTVTLVDQGGKFKFTEGINLFYFSDIETHNTGLLSQICGNLNNLVSPIAIDGTNLLYFSTEEIVGSDCLTTSSDELCIKVEKAVKVVTDTQEEKGKVHTRDWMRVKVRSDLARYGFVSYQKRISNAGCADGEIFGRTATLK